MSVVMFITILGINKVNKTLRKCLLSESFVHELHTVDLHDAFVFLKEPLPLAPAVFFDASDEES